ncbi:hypothetical protein [Halorientalis regularis]|jgi:putative membrane protein|uniref:Uncharacterized protein n=1 Tax=Halorientalis regularis TaxID=660518 RepID=A0A1G7I3N7_9EURY|nr:hypothetical protein [Halorientalis regularis]SDF07076.1 hypothetical protein SAMN05216218_103260 [Halorientalis regularis]
MSRTATRLTSVTLAVGVALALLVAAGGLAAGHSGDDWMHHHDGGMWAGLG